MQRLSTSRYPTKPVRLLVGNAPGGGIDLTARAIAQKLSAQWGRSVVVDNRPGASGLVAMDLTAQATADGYTLLVTAGSLVASAQAQNKLRYDVRKAFAPISQLTSSAYLLLVNPGLPVRSTKELIAYAKTKPGMLNYGHAGVGSAGHAGMELLRAKAGIEITPVAYKGSGLMLIDLMSNQVQLGLASTIAGMSHVRSGKLLALAVTAARRTQSIPELPTIAESGIPGYDLVNWYGLFAPAAMPPARSAALHRDVVQVLNHADVRALFGNDGAEAAPSRSREDFGALLANELAKWEEIVRIPGFAATLR